MRDSTFWDPFRELLRYLPSSLWRGDRKEKVRAGTFPPIGIKNTVVRDEGGADELSTPYDFDEGKDGQSDTQTTGHNMILLRPQQDASNG